jgi:hypothetical protein
MRFMADRRDVRRVCAGALLAAALFGAGPLPATAEVRVVDGVGGTLVVEAHDASIRQVLEALSTSHTIRFRASEALSRVVNGTYTGTLSHVLSRILDGYDHVILSTPAGLRLDIVGTARTGAVTASAARAVTNAVAVMPNVGQRVSSNVDLDEENAQAAAGGNRQATAPASVPAYRPAPPTIQPSRAVLTGNAQLPGAPRVSSNLDLDEEMSR